MRRVVTVLAAAVALLTGLPVSPAAADAPPVTVFIEQLPLQTPMGQPVNITADLTGLPVGESYTVQFTANRASFGSVSGVGPSGMYAQAGFTWIPQTTETAMIGATVLDANGNIISQNIDPRMINVYNPNPSYGYSLSIQGADWDPTATVGQDTQINAILYTDDPNVVTVSLSTGGTVLVIGGGRGNVSLTGFWTPTAPGTDVITATATDISGQVVSTTTATYTVTNPLPAAVSASASVYREAVKAGHRSPLAPIGLSAQVQGPRVHVTAGNLGAGCEAYVALNSANRVERSKRLTPGTDWGHWGHQLTFKGLTPGRYTLNVSTFGSGCAHPGHAIMPVTVT